MSHFEFLMIIAGVVVAIGMTEIVSGWGRWIRAVDDVEFDWLYFGWSVNAIYAALIYYVGMWPYHMNEFVYLGQVVFLVIPTLFFVLFVYAITPGLPLHGKHSYWSYYWSKRKSIYLSYAFFIGTAVLADIVIAGVEFFWLDLIPGFVLLLFFFGLMFVEKLWVHMLWIYMNLIGAIAELFTPFETMLERFPQ
jgi:hypothetical protein